MGPNTEPCGTPQVMSGEEDDKLPTVTGKGSVGNVVAEAAHCCISDTHPELEAVN